MRTRTAIPERRRRTWREQGSVLVEVSLGMGMTSFLALILMKASLLALSNNQWTIMQTLTDAYLTRETALAHRVPVADLTGPDTKWPDSAVDDPPRLVQTVELGRTAGNHAVNGTLTRYRVDETPADNADTGIAVWRLHSVLTYKIGDAEYVKSRSTLRMQ
jgi:hypothetical protein